MLILGAGLSSLLLRYPHLGFVSQKNGHKRHDKYHDILKLAEIVMISQSVYKIEILKNIL